MKILAIETSSTACSVALLVDNEVRSIHENAPMQQAQKVLLLIDKLLHETGVSLNQLNALTFGCGPGSFTGVRIATSVMQGIGYAMDLPLIPISSLAALAQATYEDLNWKNMLVCIDARIQEVYFGAYQVNDEGLVKKIDKEIVCSPEQIPLSAFDQDKWQAVGNGWDVYQEQILFKPLVKDSLRLPMASGLLSLAKKKYENRDWVKASEALPVYLRDDVAQKKR